VIPSFERELAVFTSSITYGDLPGGIDETVTRAFIDTIGVTLAGLDSDSGVVLDSFLERNHRRRAIDLIDAPVSEAAFTLGMASHALDYDDLSWAIDGHPSVTLVPPILALSSILEIDGRDAITAYSVGFEVESAVAEPISPSHYEDGWHATATFGTFGATAAAASLLDLSVTETQTALNVAASMPAGTKRNFGSMTKPLHTGLTARAGVTAALFAEQGVTSGTEAISGDRGFWDLYDGSPGYRPRLLRNDWYLERYGIHTKRYPCCYFTHSTIAAVRDLRDEHGIAADDVEAIQISVAQGAADALTYDDPQTGLEAKFSMPHAVAVALTRENVSLDAFNTEALADSTLRTLYDRVSFTTDDSLSYDSHATFVKIKMREGNIVSARREHPPWVHEHPPERQALYDKFLECTTRTISEERARKMLDRLTSLPERRLTGIIDNL